MPKKPTPEDQQALTDTLRAWLVNLHDSELVQAIRLLGDAADVAHSANAIADEVARRLRVGRLKKVQENLNG